ncbi:MAG: hypothetical protein JNK61_07500 [Bacteroidia bacterium]|nr:hypothetical protein [Bacteroidia bacterium]
MNGQYISKQIDAQLFTFSDGLPSNIIYKTVVDSKGFLWLATHEGLSRFDGQKFYNYYEDISKPNALQNGIVQNIVVFNDSLLLIATVSGLHVFNTNSFQFVNEMIKPAAIKAGNNANITTIQMLKNGSVVIGTFDQVFFFDRYLNCTAQHTCMINGKVENFIGGISFMDADSSILIFGCFKTSNKYGFLNVNTKTFFSEFEPIRCLTDSDFALSAVYFDVPRNTYYFSKYMKQFEVVKDNKLQILKLPTTATKNGINSAKSLYADNNTLWIGAEDGLHTLDLNTQQLTTFTLNVNGKLQIKKVFMHVCKDAFNNFWISSATGLFLIKATDTKSNIYSLDDGTSTASVEGVLQVADLYCWYTFGAGIICTDSSFNIKKKYSNPTSNYIASISNINNKLYVSSTTGFYKLDTDGPVLKPFSIINDTLQNKGTTALFTDSEKRKWLCYGAGKGVIMLDSNDSYKRFFANYLAPNHPDYLPIRNISYYAFSNETLYAGYNQGGPLVCFNNKTGRFEKVPLVVNQKNYDYFIVTGLVADSNSNIWIITQSHGVFSYNTKTKRSMRYNLPHYPIKNYCYSGVLINHILYVATIQHIVALDVRTLKFTTIPYTNALKQCPQITLMHKTQGGVDYLVASGNLTLQQINLNNLTTNQNIPNTYITQVSNSGNDLPINLRGNFTNSSNQLNLTYTAVCLNASNNFIYAYRLQPLMSSFTTINNTQNLSFYFLKPGNYTFEVRSTLDGNLWSKPAVYHFIIQQPWWQTWWFYASILIVTSGGIYTYFYIKQRNIKKLQAIRERISRDLHDEIGGTLSSINIISKAFQPKADNESRNALIKINERSQKLLNSMYDIIWSINPANDSMNDLTTRMRSYASTLLEAKNIAYEINMPDFANKQMLTLEVKNHIYLIFKEAVNNAAKYAQCNHLKINLHFYKKKLTLNITDNGVGFDVGATLNPGNGYGLANMRYRAQAINGTLHIASYKTQGTTIVLTVQL